MDAILSHIADGCWCLLVPFAYLTAVGSLRQKWLTQCMSVNFNVFLKLEETSGGAHKYFRVCLNAEGSLKRRHVSGEIFSPAVSHQIGSASAPYDRQGNGFSEWQLTSHFFELPEGNERTILHHRTFEASRNERHLLIARFLLPDSFLMCSTVREARRTMDFFWDKLRHN